MAPRRTLDTASTRSRVWNWMEECSGRKNTPMNTDSSLVRAQHTLFFSRRFNSELKMVLGELLSDEVWEEWVHNSTAR